MQLANFEFPCLSFLPYGNRENEEVTLSIRITPSTLVHEIRSFITMKILSARHCLTVYTHTDDRALFEAHQTVNRNILKY